MIKIYNWSMQWKKVLIGLLIAGSGSALVYIGENVLSLVDFGQYAVFVSAVASGLIQIGRKILIPVSVSILSGIAAKKVAEGLTNVIQPAPDTPSSGSSVETIETNK